MPKLFIWQNVLIRNQSFFFLNILIKDNEFLTKESSVLSVSQADGSGYGVVFGKVQRDLGIGKVN